MAGISDFIMKKLLGEAQASQSPATPQGQPSEQMAPPPNQGAQPSAGPGPGSDVDPLVDDIAKKLATLEGSPEQKYQIFVQLVPQIAQAFLTRMQQGQGQGAAQPPQGGGYDAQSGGMGQPQ